MIQELAKLSRNGLRVIMLSFATIILHNQTLAQPTADEQTSLPQLGSENSTFPPRISLFYFEDELAPPPVARKTATILHASAIQIGSRGDASIWINGTELRVNDQIGPAKILRIGPTDALLRIASPSGEDRLLTLAMNQSLSLNDMTVQEGVATPALRQALPKTRLP